MNIIHTLRKLLFAWRAIWRKRTDDPYARIHEIDPELP